MEALPFLVVAFFIAIAVAIGVATYRREQRRVAALTAFAASKGWTYERHDSYNLPARWDGTPFGQGYARLAEHVLTGSVHDLPLVAFDYRYKEDSNDSKGNRQTTTYQFGVCVLRMPCPLPDLRVSPESFLSRVGQALGMHDIELESEDFNRAYRVSSSTPKFASDVLHPRTMELLLRCEPRLQFRLSGPDLVCWASGKAEPAGVLMRSESAARVVEGIPDFVWKDHGRH